MRPERFGLLAAAEWTAREQRKLQRRLHTAKLRYPASLEAVDFSHPRRLNRQQVTRRHSDSRWSIWFGPDVHRESWLGSSSRRPRRYETGSRRLIATPESAPTA